MKLEQSRGARWMLLFGSNLQYVIITVNTSACLLSQPAANRCWDTVVLSQYNSASSRTISGIIWSMSLSPVEGKLVTALAKFLYLRTVLPTKYAYSSYSLKAAICIYIEILIRTAKWTWKILAQSGKSHTAVKFLYMPQHCHCVQTHRCSTIPTAASLCKNLAFWCVLKYYCAMYPFTRDDHRQDIPCSFRAWHGNSSPLLLQFVVERYCQY